MAVYLGQPRWAGTTTLRNINPIYHPRCPQIPHKHSIPSLPGLPVLADLLLIRTLGDSLKKHEEPENTNSHFLHTRLILDLMRPLVDCWFPLTHASLYDHQLACSSHIATQTRVRVNPATHLKVCLRRMPFLSQPSLFLGLRIGSEYEFCTPWG